MLKIANDNLNVLKPILAATITPLRYTNSGVSFCKYNFHSSMVFGCYFHELGLVEFFWLPRNQLRGRHRVILIMERDYCFAIKAGRL